MHTELAKCEEDVEQNQVAIDHIKKAMLLDDEGTFLSSRQLCQPFSRISPRLMTI